MAQYYHKTNTAKAVFPLISEDLGHTVLIGQAEEPAVDQIVYMHNMLPTKQGYASVAYNSIVSAVSGQVFSDVRIMFGDQGTRFHLAVTDAGDIYLQYPDAVVWTPIVFGFSIAGKLLTIGTVNGTTYLFFRDVGCFKFNEGASTFNQVVLAGLTESALIGISGSSGYLVAYTETAIAWSSTLSPLDFTPSAVTGAGGGEVYDIDGQILFVVPNSLGILIYSEANVVAGTFTGNRKYPFKLREVTNSKGALNLDLIAYEANSKEHYAYSKAGLQAVDSQNATTILPEATDFLSGKQMEDFDEGTYLFSLTTLASTMLKKVKLIASRYLVISYGETEFTHALVYDVVLQRLGKLRITHTDVFEYIGTQQEVAKNTVAFLLSTGEIKTMSNSQVDASSGAIVFGRYQYVRSRNIQLQEVTVANVNSGDTFNCRAIPSLNGSDLDTPVAGYLAETGAKLRKYNYSFEGKNCLVALVGKMDLNTLYFIFTLGGKQ